MLPANQSSATTQTGRRARLLLIGNHAIWLRDEIELARGLRRWRAIHLREQGEPGCEQSELRTVGFIERSTAGSDLE